MRTAIRASELDEEYAEMGGWEAETDASQHSSAAWAFPRSMHYALMASMDGRLKVKVLLAQALFGNPDILLLDEPTNNLDIERHQLAGGLPAGLCTAPSSWSAMTATS